MAPAERPAEQGISGLDAAGEAALIASARDPSPVEGLTHTHYRYPARFSPRLAREAILRLTAEGDLVGDVFVGGGTTCVESLALQRRSFGVDVSALAAFVAETKTYLAPDDTLRHLEEWASDAAGRIDMRRPEPAFEDWRDGGYMRHLGSRRWRLRKAIAQAVASVADVDAQAECLARITILRAAQRAIDGRKAQPSLRAFRRELVESARAVAAGTRALALAAGEAPCRPLILNCSCVGIENEPAVHAMGQPRLFLLSPPYPGVHVLYHRWQVGGGKETPAPFYIANRLDGAGSAFYTMGDYRARGLPTYFARIKAALSSVAALSGPRTTVVQVVAFAEPCWQLPAYLEAAAAAGLQEVGLRMLATEGDGRLWREVPNRRWYTTVRGHEGASREVVLFHIRA